MIKDCYTCRYHLGGGCCRLNSEKECAENEFELWELPIHHGDHGYTTKEEALKALKLNY